MSSEYRTTGRSQNDNPVNQIRNSKLPRKPVRGGDDGAVTIVWGEDKAVAGQPSERSVTVAVEETGMKPMLDFITKQTSW